MLDHDLKKVKTFKERGHLSWDFFASTLEQKCNNWNSDNVQTLQKQLTHYIKQPKISKLAIVDPDKVAFVTSTVKF